MSSDTATTTTTTTAAAKGVTKPPSRVSGDRSWITTRTASETAAVTMEPSTAPAAPAPAAAHPQSRTDGEDRSAPAATSSASAPTWLHAPDTSAFHPSRNVPLHLSPIFPNPSEMVTTAAASGTTDLVQHNPQLYHPYYPSSSGLCHYQGYLPEGCSGSSIGNTYPVGLRPNQLQQPQQQHSLEEQIHHLMQLRRLQLIEQLQFQNGGSHQVQYLDQHQQQQQQQQQQLQQQLHHDARQETDEVHLPLKKRRIAKKTNSKNRQPVEAATATTVAATSQKPLVGSSLDISVSSTSTSSTGNFVLSTSSSMTTTEDERMAAMTLMSAFGTRNTTREDGSSVSTPVFDTTSTTGTATTMTTTATTMVPIEAFSEAAAAASNGMFMTTTAEQRHETWTPREDVSWAAGTVVDVIGGGRETDHIPSLVTPDAVPRTSVRRTIAVHPLLEEPMDSTNHDPSDHLPSEGSGYGVVSSLQFPLSSSPEQYHDQQKAYGTDKKYHFKALPDSTLTIRPSSLIGEHVSGTESESTTELAFPTFKNNSSKNSNITSMQTTSDQSSQLEKIVPTKRVFHPKLEQPLPGGCHGKTSRNGGFCRRGPCFGGSKYCKLHYQHWARTGSPTIVLKSEKSNNSRSNSPLSRDGTVATSSNLHAKGQEGSVKSKLLQGNDDYSYKALTCTLISQGNVSSSSEIINGNVADLSAPYSSSLALKTTRKSHQPHDRQYTGAPGQVRCQATTTRGRPCKYVAATSTSSGSSDNAHPKYCRMHANHDTNPSQPRRVKKRGLPIELAVHVGPTGSEPTRAKHDSSKIGQVKRKKKGKKSTKPSSSIAASNGVSTDIPVGLNSLPTAKWHDQKVTITTGPYSNHTGRVVKWNNGWVTVCVDSLLAPASDEAPDVVHHNRRSFELLLC